MKAQLVDGGDDRVRDSNWICEISVARRISLPNRGVHNAKVCQNSADVLFVRDLLPGNLAPNISQNRGEVPSVTSFALQVRKSRLRMFAIAKHGDVQVRDLLGHRNRDDCLHVGLL